MDGMIKITGVDLVAFAKDVYELSTPQGLGMLHARPDGLSDEDAKRIATAYADDKREALSMDYVHGRSCKMHVRRDDNGDLWIGESWYDHSSAALDDLLARHASRKQIAGGEVQELLTGE